MAAAADDDDDDDDECLVQSKIHSYAKNPIIILNILKKKKNMSTIPQN